MTGFCGEYITLYKGRVENQRLVAHQACCLILSGEPITVTDAHAQTSSGTLLVVPSMARHRVAMPAEAIFVFLDPHLPFARRHLSIADRLHPDCSALQARLTPAAGVLPAFAWLIDQLNPYLFRQPERTDPRVMRLAEFIRQHLDQKLTLTALARAAGLSIGRLQHLFVAQVGMPITRYLHWQRLKVAYGHVLAGHSLTAAAYEGGFADAAHFSRTFRHMFGAAPSQLLRK